MFLNMVYVNRETNDGYINLKRFLFEFLPFKCIAAHTVFRICIDIFWVNIILTLNLVTLTTEFWFEIFVPQGIYGL